MDVIGLILLLVLIGAVLLGVWILGSAAWYYLPVVVGDVGGVTIWNFGYENIGVLLVVGGFVVHFFKNF